MLSNRLKLTCYVVFVLLSFPATEWQIATAEIPKTISYQGFLKDQNGDAIYDTLTIKFCLWNVETGGNTPLWCETHSVDIEGGIYSVVLGLTNPVNLPFDVPYYLGVTVGGDQEMTPRQRLSSVPYALNTQLQSETDPTVLESVKDGISWTEVADRPDGLDDGDDVGIEEETDPEVGTNVTGYISKWTGTALEKGSIFDNGNVGIGTATPSSKLEVAGVIHSNTGGIKFPDGTTQISAATGGTISWNVSGTNLYYTDGNIALGHTDPGDYRLYVSGELRSTNHLMTDNYLVIAGSGAAGGHFPNKDFWFQYQDGQGDLHIGRNGWDPLVKLKRNQNVLYTPGSLGVGTETPHTALELPERGLQIGSSETVTDNFHIVSDTHGGPRGLRFWNGNYGSGSHLMTILDNGAVGIGTTSPQGQLHINFADSGGYGLILDGSRSDNQNFILFRNSYWTDDENSCMAYVGALDSVDQGGHLVFGTTAAGSGVTGTPTERVRITKVGNVGIGTANPAVALDLNAQNVQDGGLRVFGTGDSGGAGDMGIRLVNTGEGGSEWFIDSTSKTSGYGGGKLAFVSPIGNHPAMVLTSVNVGVGTNEPTEKLHVNGNILATGMTTTDSLKITGGADIAEPFKVSEKHQIKPGMVVSIDPENPGELKLSEKAYDRCVAGIVSGAGGINTGMVMSQMEAKDGHSQLVALTGRAYCWCDATERAVQPGDLLTTSDTPGHAQKVLEYANAPGAIIGKAMSSLDSGKGLVLVLVALQ